MVSLRKLKESRIFFFSGFFTGSGSGDEKDQENSSAILFVFENKKRQKRGDESVSE